MAPPGWARSDEYAFRVDPTTGVTEPLIESELASFGFWERRDLQRWIIDRPEIVEADLLLVTTEFDRWQGRDQVVADRLDVLFLDSDGRLLVAELKRGEAPDTTHLQALKYAAYCSQLTVADVVEEYMRTHSIDHEKARADVLEHAPALETKELGRIRFRLVAEHFGPSVTHVVMWLRDYDLDIGCVEVTARRHPDGSALITSRRLLPPPAAEDYLVKRRQREVEETEREVTTRSRNSVTILLEAGALRPGQPLRLNVDRLGEAQTAIEAAIEQNPLVAQAEWTGLSLNEALRWRRDGNLYACTPIVLQLLKEVGFPRPSIAGPQCWIDENGRSLAELAYEIEPRRQADSTAPLSLIDLIAAGVLAPGTRVRPKRDHHKGEGIIRDDGTIEIDGRALSPTAASNRVGGSGSGWDFWAVQTESNELQTLAEIRRQLNHARDTLTDE